MLDAYSKNFFNIIITAQCSESGPVPNYGYHVDMAFLVEVTKSGVKQVIFFAGNLFVIIREH